LNFEKKKKREGFISRLTLLKKIPHGYYASILFYLHHIL